jgi:hypothetical protein
LSKVILLVMPGGYDVIGELHSETDTMFELVEPRLLSLNPAKREISFVNYAPHLDPADVKKPLPIMKAPLLTWYKPKESMAKAYISSKVVKSANDMGIVLPGQEGFGLKP